MFCGALEALGLDWIRGSPRLESRIGNIISGEWWRAGRDPCCRRAQEARRKNRAVEDAHQPK